LDAQLNIPESGNSIPDILDEARWGIEVWRQAQEPDGRVATWIEATSHPKTSNPGHDHQPYYLGLATRQSSLNYAAHAALLARGLLRAGATEVAAIYIASARAAFAFGSRTDLRVGFNLTATVRWDEPEEVGASYMLYAAAQLLLATEDSAFSTLLETDPKYAAALTLELNNAHWQNDQTFGLLAFASNPEKFPSSGVAQNGALGWGAACEAKYVEQADAWLGRQAANPYRKVWYTPDHGYFKLMAWGSNGFRPIKWLTAAFAVTGDTKYRDGALLGVNWMHGSNPLGRPFTTGLGHTPMTAVLSLPSYAEGGNVHDEPIPGITIYGIIGAVTQTAATRVFGLFDDARSNDPYNGAAIAQLPPPYYNTSATLQDVKEKLETTLPWWRRLTMLESQNVPITEYTVAETIGHAAAVVGMLMGPGWLPPDALKDAPARSRDELLDGWMIQP